MLAQLAPWQSPAVDYHALAPEIVLAGAIVALLVADLFLPERQKWATSTIAGLGLLAPLVPILTLAVDGTDRSMFNGGYVVDNFSLVLKALFLLAGYVVILLSTTYVEEGDYYQGEYYFLLLSSVLGMVMMASSRDLVSIFVALELLSIPAYMLAAWRKRDEKSNEAGMKYFLLGVFASAVMLYGMSLFYGVAGTTLLTGVSDAVAGQRQRARDLAGGGVHRRRLRLQGLGGAVPQLGARHVRGRAHADHGVPVGVVQGRRLRGAAHAALRRLPLGAGRVRALFWVLSVLTMTVGNVLALRQTNIVRMLAYSSISQGGFILMPLAVAGDPGSTRAESLQAVITYLIVYAATNLGAFAVVLAVARKTRSGEISSYDGLISYARSGHGHDDLPGVAGRRAAARRLDRQVRRVHGRAGTGHDGRCGAGGDRRDQLGHRLRLLRPGHAGHVDGHAPDGDVAPIRVPSR